MSPPLHSHLLPVQVYSARLLATVRLRNKATSQALASILLAGSLARRGLRVDWEETGVRLVVVQEIERKWLKIGQLGVYWRVYTNRPNRSKQPD